MKTMLNEGTGSLQGQHNQDLGLVICSKCGEMVDTLPTNGVKIIHGLCQSPSCSPQTEA
ncbi:GapA-binding peptide SR1P [Paenibacillus sp. JSM ZJ436]|uniref:GapA-binding peptide SR1P n=1 Tax=Paenibacillus sp. JSM ZJ436 TaxID=3376190 RepID=UPI00379E730D